MSGASDELAQTVRIEGSRLLATLVRTVGDLRLAEDAVQEAAVRALRDWPRSGVPAEPRAWLTVAARRAAIDMLRRESRRADKERDASAMAHLTDEPQPVPASVVRDDQLRLMFVCCHPALSLESQVPLALRVLCGLSPAQIAEVLLTTEAAVAKRLTRTRAKIARAAIPYRVPDDAELPARLAGVCAVVHAAYTAAHTASGAELSDVDSCVEARRLARLVHDLLPDEPMPAAVLALILLTEARRPGRVDAAGEVVLLADQDRTTWDRAAADEGRRLLGESLRRTAGVADAYQLEAAIAAEHAVAVSYEATDWHEITRLYDLLSTVRPTSSARLARAVAIAEADGAAAGLRALDDVPAHSRREAVRSELLARLGRPAEAAQAARESLAAGFPAAPAAERRHRERRIAEWTAAANPRRETRSLDSGS